MKKLFSIAIMIIFTLTLLTTCLTAQAGNASTTAAPTTAAQLARELNAMNEGSARASGNTVTLTKGTGVQRDLTVPAGVTFELTGDGGLYLRDNITLTVNDTVNAPSNKIGTDDEGGRTAPSVTINGNGTINLTGKGTLIDVGNGRKLTLDGVTLVGIADNDSPLIRTGVNGELVLVSGAITGNSTSHPGAGVFVDQGGTFTMSGGAITGNTSTSNDWAGGGGVNLWHGTFTMSGGAISGNSAVGVEGSGGGGVLVGEGSTFIMSGGEISGNTSGSGGGVRASEGGTFTMSGGEITGNTCSGNGGGVELFFRAAFTMNGGVISGNTAWDSGGVRIVGATFTMNGGTIYGATEEGGRANIATGSGRPATMYINGDAKWGTGGTYTRGGVNQTGGSNIAPTNTNINDTLIAIPAR